jgi:threonine/homoserine/homoserine lactone efflux protein
MLISFLGCLPLGTLNITAMLIAVQENTVAALWFALGCLLVEMLYVRISLIGIAWLRKQIRLMRIMEWLTLVIIAALAAGSFMAALRGGGEARNVILENPMPRFWLGVLMSAISPMQFPFWFGWSNVLFEKGTLKPLRGYYNSYILGIGAGTLMGNGIFIFGGQLLVKRIAGVEEQLNWIIGGIFALTALIWLYKLIRRRDAVSRLEEK